MDSDLQAEARTKARNICYLCANLSKRGVAPPSPLEIATPVERRDGQLWRLSRPWDDDAAIPWCRKEGADLHGEVWSVLANQSSVQPDQMRETEFAELTQRVTIGIIRARHDCGDKWELWDMYSTPAELDEIERMELLEELRYSNALQIADLQKKIADTHLEVLQSIASTAADHAKVAELTQQAVADQAELAGSLVNLQQSSSKTESRWNWRFFGLGILALGLAILQIPAVNQRLPGGNNPQAVIVATQTAAPTVTTTPPPVQQTATPTP